MVVAAVVVLSAILLNLIYTVALKLKIKSCLLHELPFFSNYCTDFASVAYLGKTFRLFTTLIQTEFFYFLKPFPYTTSLNVILSFGHLAAQINRGTLHCRTLLLVFCKSQYHVSSCPASKTCW